VSIPDTTPRDVAAQVADLAAALAAVLAKSAQHGRPAETLTDHSRSTVDTGMVVRDRVGVIAGLPARFWIWALLAELFHDLGKVADGMDCQLRTDVPWGQRHEVLSLGFLPHLLGELPADEQVWIATGIAAHHRPFTSDTPGPRRAVLDQYKPLGLAEFTAGFGPVNAQTAATLAAWCGHVAHTLRLLPQTPAQLHELSADVLGAAARTLIGVLDTRWRRALPWSRRADGETGVLLLGAIAMADHVASAHGELLTTPPLQGFFDRLRKHLWTPSQAVPHRHQLDAASTLGHLIVCTPTGSGKTETALAWAETTIAALIAECAGLPRTFYVLPFLASINAMALRMEKAPVAAKGKVGVLHSRAGQHHLNHPPTTMRRVEAAEHAVTALEASRNFRELLKITTPYQLLRGTLGGPSNAATLLDTINSVFVFDELHAYEPQRLGMILAMMSWWCRHGGRIAVLSATLPTALITMLRDTVLTDRPVTLIDAHTTAPPAATTAGTAQTAPRARHQLRISPHQLTDEQTLAEIRDEIRTGLPVFVVANNIAHAIKIYDALKDETVAAYGQDAALLLHSRFEGRHRAAIETRIMTRYDADRRDPLPGLCVSTQVLEVSLHISGAILHTSGAPLEPLWQRFGRINRSGFWDPSPVTVHTPDYTTRAGTEFADGVYPAEPTRITMDLLAAHDGQLLWEAAMQPWLDTVYDSAWGTEWARAVDRSRRAFTTAFLGFQRPFHHNADLEERFAELFDGVEAVWSPHLPDYLQALRSTETTAAGRLLASEFLIPLPGHQLRNTTYHPGGRVLVFDGDYDPTYGLREVTERQTAAAGPRYNLWEIL
jgi:CRISPR-associated helicase Cas3/CRISPR-associated endonuclease Cas3-HD